MPDLVVENLVKRFGDVVAVDEIDFTVHDGEFLTLLGPSGCGKSTTLFAIAGLDKPDGGRITVGDTTFYDSRTGTFVAPEKRNCGMVFQSYALWPHMTVSENLAYPLKLRKLPRQEQKERIRESLTLVELEEYGDRYPHQLSGGQQQRVALGRALVYSPHILLLDEPLSNLDAKLRERARVWLKRLQSKLGITTVYVTHDQIEALALSDRIAVMRKGRIRQIDTPQNIYMSPGETFVADFVGNTNFFKGRVLHTEQDGTVTVQLEGHEGTLTVRADQPFPEQSPIVVSIRPEKMLLFARGENNRPPAGSNCLGARIVERSYLGARYQYRLQIDQLLFSAETEDDFSSEKLWVILPAESCVIFDSATD